MSSNKEIAVPPYPDDVPLKQKADLAAARARASFDATKMQAILFTKDALEKRARALKIVEGEKLFMDCLEEWSFLGRTEKMQRILPIMARLAEIKLENGFSRDDMLPIYGILGFTMPIFNHEQTFFAAGLSSNASPEQMAYWGPLGEEYRFWGCYAQTELGHGSNVSALETMATYDPATQEFIMNTPTLSATKWWIGALGTMATHALVMARLIIKGKDLGTHAFMVPIRDMRNHEPLPGVWCGDIGPKFGASTIDNGFLRLDNVRIPRENMLSRNSSVTPTGEFVRPKHEKLFLGGMLVRRTEITASSARALAKACTVGVRYGEVRRQNWGIGHGVGSKRTGEEAAILGYPMVQIRVLVPLAAAFSFVFTGSWLVNFFTNYRSQFLNAKDDSFLDTLSDFHPTLSGLKSYCTTVAADSIEDIRRCLGGHGYSLASGLGTLYRNYVSTNTVEGENILMTQQAARYLMKLARQLKANDDKTREKVGSSPVTAYLTRLYQAEGPSRAVTEEDFADPRIQIEAFNHRARRLVAECYDTVTRYNGDLGSAAPEAAAVSVAHCQNLIVTLFWSKVEELESKGADPACMKALRNLAALNGLALMVKHAGEFLEDGYFSGKQIKVVRNAFHALLPQVRSDAPALVDAWDISDTELQSQLGRKDGNAYESYFLWVQREPVNQGKGGKGVIPGYEQYLKPLLSGEVAARAKKVREARAQAKL